MDINMRVDHTVIDAELLGDLASGNGLHAARTRVDVRNDALAADWLRLELGRGQLSGIFRRDALLVHAHTPDR